MEQEILNKISYGLYIVTANQNGRDNGCIIDTVMQVSKEPQIISFSIYKTSYTCEMIQNTRRCTISLLNNEVQIEMIKHFAYQSGRDVDKFASFYECKKTVNGTMAILKDTNAYFLVDIKHQLDFGSHILFIGEPTEGEILCNGPTVTYDYYAKNIKQ